MSVEVSAMSTSKVITFRLSQEQVDALETVATFDGVALAEELREGVELLLEARRGDPEFRRRVRDSLKKAESILSGVDGGDSILAALRPRAELEVEDVVPAAAGSVSAALEMPSAAGAN
jgi:hypothetical protein